jgi:hypothetical protein|tara:strand:- start:2109 stop:2381 length:273 start_codon:yes stop_codon:yes gene_type:complete
MSLVNLDSVGCVINSNNGLVCSVMADGSIDLDDLSNACHVNDIENEEWFDALSQQDIDIIEDILGNPTDTLLDNTEADYLEMKAELHYGI